MLTLQPQFRHLPLKVKKYEIMGILSYHFIGELHFGHFEAGKIIDSFDIALSATTFKKLPMHAPVIKTKKHARVISSIIFPPILFLFPIIFQEDYLVLFLVFLTPAFVKYRVFVLFAFDLNPQNNSGQ